MKKHIKNLRGKLAGAIEQNYMRKKVKQTLRNAITHNSEEVFEDINLPSFEPIQPKDKCYSDYIAGPGPSPYTFIRNFLKARKNKPWNDVRSEICATYHADDPLRKLFLDNVEYATISEDSVEVRNSYGVHTYSFNSTSFWRDSFFVDQNGILRYFTKTIKRTPRPRIFNAVLEKDVLVVFYKDNYHTCTDFIEVKNHSYRHTQEITTYELGYPLKVFSNTGKYYGCKLNSLRQMSSKQLSDFKSNHPDVPFHLFTKS